MRLLKVLAVAVLAAGPVGACSCGYGTIRACDMFFRAPVIFRGKLIDHNYDTGKFSQRALYRFQVEEVFKGLDPGVKEVFIDPDAVSMCGWILPGKEEMLIYTSVVGRLATWVEGRGKGHNPLLPAWEGLGAAPVLIEGSCSRSRPVKPGDPDVEYYRRASQNRLPRNGSVEGRVIQSGFIGLAGAVASVKVGGVTRTAMSAVDGSYRIEEVPPGEYRVSFTAPGLGPALMHNPIATVPAGGCGVVNAGFETHATISGTVLSAEGRPVGDVPLKLAEVPASGNPRVIPSAWTHSDQEGRFTFREVPTGRIVMGVNLDEPPILKRPYDRTYAPGTNRVDAARILRVRPGEEIKGITLRLPKPLAFGWLFVDVLWPDGSPAKDGASATVYLDGATVVNHRGRWAIASPYVLH